MLVWPWGLPTNTRITIRDITPGLRKMVAKAQPGWQGDRVSVEVCGHVNVVTSTTGAYSGHYATARLINLYDGTHTSVHPTQMTENVPRHAADFGVKVDPLDLGLAVVVFRLARGWRPSVNNADVTFYVNTFTQSEYDAGQLAVARDAVQCEDYRTAGKLAREILPYSAPLFLALMRREKNILAR